MATPIQVFVDCDIRYVRYGAHRKFYLDIPCKRGVGCKCQNPNLWTNIFDKLSQVQKLVLPEGTTAVYLGKCDRCRAQDKIGTDKRNKRNSELRRQNREARERGDRITPICPSCPNGMPSKFTPKRDGTCYAVCDYHRSRDSRRVLNSWHFRQTLIDPATQALCRRCSGVFTPSQMTQHYFNVRGQRTFERRVSFCPRHYEMQRERVAENSRQVRLAMSREMLVQLKEHTEPHGMKGCAHPLCPLDRNELCKELVTRHGEELGTRLFTTSFDCDHEPRVRDRRKVSSIFNEFLRARERSRTQPLCTTGCHRYKTWEQFEWSHYLDSNRGQRNTRQSVTLYMELKLRRFEGRDPNRKGECGCQGYEDEAGNKFECPFQEYLAAMKTVFERATRLGRETTIDIKYGFLSMYTHDHDDRNQKELEPGRMSNWTDQERLEKELNPTTMRCHSCHRFKGMLCGDFVADIHLPMTSTVLITEEDDMDDPALVITDDDDFRSLL